MLCIENNKVPGNVPIVMESSSQIILEHPVMHLPFAKCRTLHSKALTWLESLADEK